MAIFLCTEYLLSLPEISNTGMALLTILFSGLLATFIALCYDFWKKVKVEKTLLKGLISELDVNKEYLKHNYSLADQLLQNKPKPSIFIPVRSEVIVKVLTSGEITLTNSLRQQCSHYLVTIDHHNQMLKAFVKFDKSSPEYKVAIERIKRYCRGNEKEFGFEFDFIFQHLIEIQKTMRQQKKYLRNIGSEN